MNTSLRTYKNTSSPLVKENVSPIYTNEIHNYLKTNTLSNYTLKNVCAPIGSSSNNGFCLTITNISKESVSARTTTKTTSSTERNACASNGVMSINGERVVEMQKSSTTKTNTNNTEDNDSYNNNDYFTSKVIKPSCMCIHTYIDILISYVHAHTYMCLQTLTGLMKAFTEGLKGYTNHTQPKYAEEGIQKRSIRNTLPANHTAYNPAQVWPTTMTTNLNAA